MHRAASLHAPHRRGFWARLAGRIAEALAAGDEEEAGPRLARFPCGPEILPLAGLMWFPDLVAVQPAPVHDDEDRPRLHLLTRPDRA
jgi:hypothetical protein